MIYKHIFICVFACILVAGAQASVDPDRDKTVWVDVHYVGDEDGSYDHPFNTLAEATAAVGERGAINFKHGEEDASTKSTGVTSEELFDKEKLAAPVMIGERPVVEQHMNQADIESGTITFTDIFNHGRLLFNARFNKLDGQGRPATTGGGAPRVPDEPAFLRTSGPDSNACFTCHNQPGSGGSGDFGVNVFVLAQVLDPVTFSVSGNFSNERNTVGMNGAGAIELLAREMTTELHAIRDEATSMATTMLTTQTRTLIAKGVDFGEITVLPNGKIDPSAIDGVDWDLIIKPFHQKGAVVSLREFTNNAMNHHHGMQSTERFGLDLDPDMDTYTNELTVGDITANTIYQAGLSAPIQIMPEDPMRAQAVVDGRNLFDAIGCNRCHVPEMTLESSTFVEPNPFNPVGNLRTSDTTNAFTFDITQEGQYPRVPTNGSGGAIVRAFTDLKRWDLNDAEYDHFANEQIPQGNLYGFADPDDFTMAAPPRPTREFLSAKLWTVGNSEPYGHRGDLTLMTEAIHFHGGESRTERDAFFSLSQADQDKIIEFLKSLQVVAPQGPLKNSVDKSWKKLN